MNCKAPVYLAKNDMWVPCGRCILCRVQRAREWSTRLVHELNYWDASCFVTLTYDNEHLPENLSVSKYELQTWMKRLRKLCEGRTIKYYATGEYGDKFGRPHYHAILYGLDRSSSDKWLLDQSWGKGRIKCGTVTYDSCRYVGDYVQKKLYGLRANEYTDAGLEQPFALMSQGIGKRWAEDNVVSILTNQFVTIHGATCAIPRYYIKKLGVDTETLDKADIRAEEKKQIWLKKHPGKTSLDYLGQLNERAKRMNLEAENKQVTYKKGTL